MDKDKQIKKIPNYSPEELTKCSNLLQRGLLDIDKINDPITREELKNIVIRGLKKAQFEREKKGLEIKQADPAWATEDNLEAILKEFSYEETRINKANIKRSSSRNLKRLEKFREFKKRVRNALDEIRANNK